MKSKIFGMLRGFQIPEIISSRITNATEQTSGRITNATEQSSAAFEMQLELGAFALFQLGFEFVGGVAGEHVYLGSLTGEEVGDDLGLQSE